MKMFMDPAFRLALTLSVIAHLAVISPSYLLQTTDREDAEADMVELDYIIINDPRVALEEEIYATASCDNKEQENEKTGDSTSKGLALDSKESIQSSLQEETAPQEHQNEKEKAYLDYFNVLREKIRSCIHSYAPGDEKGTVEVVFTVSSNGALQKIDQIHTVLPRDTERGVIKAIRRSQPFPAFPEQLGENPLTFALTIKFTS
ncbi:MAG: hypothetical protein GF409_02050 [Candidatus Omnitrophica bacterium]|nr:hypothetical protein [Candidatus Omnitrophota bacterium]